MVALPSIQTSNCAKRWDSDCSWKVHMPHDDDHSTTPGISTLQEAAFRSNRSWNTSHGTKTWTLGGDSCARSQYVGLYVSFVYCTGNCNIATCQSLAYWRKTQQTNTFCNGDWAVFKLFRMQLGETMQSIVLVLYSLRFASISQVLMLLLLKQSMVSTTRHSKHLAATVFVWIQHIHKH